MTAKALIDYGSAGTYTPSILNDTNCTINTIGVANYMRVGNVVTVSGTVDISNGSAGTNSGFTISLPVPLAASTFSSIREAGGTFATNVGASVSGDTGIIYSASGTTTVYVSYRAGQTTNRTCSYIFTYRIA